MSFLVLIMIRIALPISTLCVFKFITFSVKLQILSLRDLLKFNKCLLLSIKVKTKYCLEWACWECAKVAAETLAKHLRELEHGVGRTTSVARCSQCGEYCLCSLVLPVWGVLPLQPGAPRVGQLGFIALEMGHEILYQQEWPILVSSCITRLPF